MLLNKQILEILECKSSKDGHIAEESIILPCGFNICSECYKLSKYCVKCKIEHNLKEELILKNHLVKDLIKENIKQLSLFKNGKNFKKNLLLLD